MSEQGGVPTSWLMIRPGWKVYASDGSEVGEVSEVTGDETRDIFDGLAVSMSLLGQPRYVPAEQVQEITEGGVRLSMSADQVQGLEEYQEPATSAAIEPDSHGGPVAEAAGEVRRLENLVHPIESHEQPLNVWRRIYLAFRRMLGR